MNNQYYINPNEFAGKIADILRANLETSQMNPNTKQTINRFINLNAIELQKQFECAIKDELANLERREAKVVEAKAIVKKAEGLAEKYPDPRARQAMVMYDDIVNRYVEDVRIPGDPYVYKQIKDEQAYRNAILSAGRIVAAYLGGSDEQTK